MNAENESIELLPNIYSKKKLSQHVVTLSENIKNVELVIRILLEKEVITSAEKDILLSPEKSDHQTSSELFVLLLKKDYAVIAQPLIDTLKFKTGNEFCASILDGSVEEEQLQSAVNESKERHRKKIKKIIILVITIVLVSLVIFGFIILLGKYGRRKPRGY